MRILWLKTILEFSNVIIDKNQLQRFIGSLNYIGPFYQGQANDIYILQQILKKNPPQWNQMMSEVIKCIKGKVQDLPPLTLPIGEGQLILETDASNKAWGDVLLEKVDK